jgi:hypothetical protein
MSSTGALESVEDGLHKVDSKDDERYDESLPSRAKAPYAPVAGVKDRLGPRDGRFILRMPSPDAFSELSIDDNDAVRPGRPLLQFSRTGDQDTSRSPAPRRTAKGMLKAFWKRNKGVTLVLIAQIFGTLMNVTTRLLEVEGNNGKGMHPFQILFARMGITAVLSTWYMWWRKTEDFPFGKKEVRWLLVARGFFGFFGVFGMYCKFICDDYASSRASLAV